MDKQTLPGVLSSDRQKMLSTEGSTQMGHYQSLDVKLNMETSDDVSIAGVIWGSLASKNDRNRECCPVV